MGTIVKPAKSLVGSRVKGPDVPNLRHLKPTKLFVPYVMPLPKKLITFPTDSDFAKKQRATLLPQWETVRGS